MNPVQSYLNIFKCFFFKSIVLQVSGKELQDPVYSSANLNWTNEVFSIIGDVGLTSRSKFVNSTADQSDVNFTKRQQEQSSSGEHLGFFWQYIYTSFMVAHVRQSTGWGRER